MTAPDPLAALCDLAAAGRLRLVYVLGVPRSNTTIVCRLLGRRLDGAVYEPAMPSARTPLRHYARAIKSVYAAARAAIPDDRPVVLAVKDLDGFLNDEMFGFALAASCHMVFTTRDPALQYLSLERQFAKEFSPLHRVRSSLRHPVEQHWFFMHALRWLPRFWRLARAELGGGLNPLRTAVAGFGYSSWRLQAGHIARARAALGAESMTIFDAGLMRLFPAEANSALDAIAAACARSALGTELSDIGPLELESHSRMAANSHWARQARAGGGIAPLSAAGDLPASASSAAFARKVSASLYPQYVQTFFDPANRQLEAVRQRPIPRDAPPGLRTLLQAGGPAAAARRLAGRLD
ncbi:MAG TPA: hypothetical protein VMW31_01050 [Devosiaceae bacterium]|nr:hypothetical protein [Devosiaceae bacterium]